MSAPTKPTKNITFGNSATRIAEPPDGYQDTGFPDMNYVDGDGNNRLGLKIIGDWLQWLFRFAFSWINWLSFTTMQYDIRLGTQNQVTNGDATVWFDSSVASPIFKDADSVEYTLTEGEKILVVGLDQVQAGKVLTFPVGVELAMLTPVLSIDLNGETCTFTSSVKGEIAFSNGGTVNLNGNCDGFKVRGSGLTVNEGANFMGSYFENGVLKTKTHDIQFVEQPDMVILTAAELANYSDDPKYVKVDQTTTPPTYKQKSGTARVPATGDWTIFKSMETLTKSLKFPSSYDRPKITTERHLQIPVRDQGAGEPFEIYIEGSGGHVELITDISMDDIIALQAGALATTAELKKQQYIKNRGERNKIILNGQQIYSGDRPTEIDFPVPIKHPYVFPCNGYSFHGIAQAAVNDDETLLIDAWKAYGGIEFLEIAPVHNPFLSSAFWYKFYTPDDAGYFKRIATPFGGTSGVDPDVHSRTSAAGSDTITSGNYTSAASAEISGISDANIKKAKMWARVYDAGLGIPGPGTAPVKTTIISKIVQNAADNNSIFMADSETGAAVSVTATGDLTIDLGGNSGVSLQEDAFQGHWHEFAVLSTNLLGSRTGPQTVYGGSLNASGPVYNSNAGGYVSVAKDDGTNGAPKYASQTRPKSTQTLRYILP